MSTETKVGAFVLGGLVFLALGIFLLGDFTFQRRYSFRVRFDDVTGLDTDSRVRLSGVEVGRVHAIGFEDGKVVIEARVRSGVPIYRDSEISVGSTGLIGSKFLAIDQGRPSSGLLQPGDTVDGKSVVSMEKAIAKTFDSLQDLIGGLNGEPGSKGNFGKNINASLENIRELTASLNEMMEDVRPRVTASLDRMDTLTAKLDTLLSKTNELMANLNSGKGTIGALMNDENMKKNVQETVASLKEAAGTANDVLGRINQFRVYWNYDWRYEHAIRTSRGDVGLKIMPRDSRYYYVGASNLGGVSDAPRGPDFERKNSIDALLGFVWKGIDLGVGSIHSAGGARLTVTPFPDVPILGRLSLMAQGYDFGRNRTVNGRLLDKPEYDFGAMVRLHRLIGVGGRVQDVQEVKRYETWVNVSFEDKDVAYLFGLVSFGAAGTRGRSKSN